MSSVELLLGGNAGAYIFHMDVCRPEYQHSNMYLRFADKFDDSAVSVPSVAV